MSPLETLLSDFESLAAKTSRPCSFGMSFDFGKHARHAVFAGLVHGDETGSLQGLLTAARELLDRRLAFGGKVTFLLGNVAAAQKGVRFLETDLNRVFTPAAKPSLERKRAQELEPILETADVFFDFHQTREPSERPFFTFGFHLESYLWARASGAASMLITRKPGVQFAKDALCIDEYVRERNRAAVTLEMGVRGLTSLAENLTHRTVRNVLATLDACERGQSLAQRAHRFQPLTLLQRIHNEPFSHPALTLSRGIQNFTSVRAGQKLGSGPHGALVAPADGFVLFPKYPERDSSGNATEPLPSDIYTLVAPLAPNILKHWERAAGKQIGKGKV